MFVYKLVPFIGATFGAWTIGPNDDSIILNDKVTLSLAGATVIDVNQKDLWAGNEDHQKDGLRSNYGKSNKDEVKRFNFIGDSDEILVKVTIISDFLLDVQPKDDNIEAILGFKESGNGDCNHKIRGDQAYHLLTSAFVCDADFTSESTCSSDPNVHDVDGLNVEIGLNRVKFTRNQHRVAYTSTSYDPVDATKNTGDLTFFVNKECKCGNCDNKGISDTYTCDGSGTWLGGSDDLDNNCANSARP